MGHFNSGPFIYLKNKFVAYVTLLILIKNIMLKHITNNE